MLARAVSNSAIDCPSTPAAPRLAFTFLKASQTSRFGMSNGFALVARLLPSPVGRLPRQDTAVPSVQFHYRTFIPTTDCSVPVPRIGTALAGASRLSFSLGIGATGSRVPQKEPDPGSRRLQAGRRSGRASGLRPNSIPGATTFLLVSTSSCEFRHVISGSLALVSPDLT